MASDNLPARRNGAWARDKLSFLDEYLPPALQATKTKLQRHYVDLFAGPGINVDDDGKEFEGGALRALKARAQSDSGIGFTHAHLVNLDAVADEALRARVNRGCADGTCAILPSAVRYENEDANLVVRAIMHRIHRRAYAFVFADFEKPNQLPYESVRSLQMLGRESVDFCVLFPSDMALKRMLPFGRGKLEPTMRALNTYLGTEAWLELWEKRTTDAQSPELYRGIQRMYQTTDRAGRFEPCMRLPQPLTFFDASPAIRLLQAQRRALHPRFRLTSASGTARPRRVPPEGRSSDSRRPGRVGESSADACRGRRGRCGGS